ncbi:MAG: formylglycine-generating enzyme family protein [bacterium]|nr:formylglycine-generating enzyme family protein [bacterium]
MKTHDHHRYAMRACSALTLLCLAQSAQSRPAPQVEFDWQTVAHPGNPPEPLFTFGSTPNVYAISKHEVTNDQYAEFLNATASLGSAHGVYEPEMGTDPRGGIARTGSGTPAAPYAFTVRADMGNKPVNFVTWFDAARFVNWLANGQGGSDTETGPYALLGGNPVDVERDSQSTHFIPSDDEWYKAAYYDPTVGPSHYWGYPTRANGVPTAAAATATGDVANPGPAAANRNRSADWAGLDGHLTTVGSAGSESFYRCADMAGNAYEWTDTSFPFGPNVARILRGGSWIDGSTVSHKSVRFAGNPAADTSWRGFRVVRSVPDEVGTPFCFGLACPCANDDAGAGCANSTGGGAALTARGTASASGDDLVVSLASAPPGQFSILFAGTTQLMSVPFSDGQRCVGGSIDRLGLRTIDGAGTATWGPGQSQAQGWSAGDVLHFQAWYRDPTGPCGSGANASHALTVLFVP